MDVNFWWGVAIAAIGFLVAGVPAYFSIRSKLLANTLREANELVETRGRRIDDLEAEVSRHKGQIAELVARIAYLEQKLQEATATQSREIADMVVSRLTEFGPGG